MSRVRIIYVLGYFYSNCEGRTSFFDNEILRMLAVLFITSGSLKTYFAEWSLEVWGFLCLLRPTRLVLGNEI